MGIYEVGPLNNVSKEPEFSARVEKQAKQIMGNKNQISYKELRKTSLFSNLSKNAKNELKQLEKLDDSKGFTMKELKTLLVASSLEEDGYVDSFRLGDVLKNQGQNRINENLKRINDNNETETIHKIYENM